MAKRKVKAKKVPPKKPLDDGKVMDVSKPGASKPLATSRPVVTTFGALLGVDKAPTDIKQPTSIPVAAAPSLSHKVIAPINAGVKPEEPGDAKEDTSKTETDEPIKISVDASAGEPKASESTTEKPADEAEETPEEEKPEPETSGTIDEETGSSEAGEVGALADAASDKKAEEKAAEEQAKKDAAVQELVASKKYYVPLAHDSTKKKSSKAPLIAIAALLVLAIGGYLAIDAGVIMEGTDLPIHVFKQNTAVPDETAAVAQTRVLPVTHLAVSYDETVWRAGSVDKDADGTNKISLTLLNPAAKDKIEVTFREYKTPTTEVSLANGVSGTVVGTEKLTTGQGATAYRCDLILKSATSNTPRTYQPTIALCADQAGTIQGVPLNSSALYSVGVTVGVIDQSALGYRQFNSLEAAQDWYKTSADYPKIKALLKNIKL